MFHVIHLFFVDEWIMFFIYIFYTTVHNINYSILKVNKYHFQHHQLPVSNMGPDIFDLLFGTKNKKTMENEQIDHYIPNILLSFLMVLFLKHLYLNKNPLYLKIGFGIIWNFSTIIILISSTFILKEQIDNALLEEIEKFVL
jgi:hypothetical protein